MFSMTRYNQRTSENQPSQYFAIVGSKFGNKNNFAKKSERSEKNSHRRLKYFWILSSVL